MAMSLLVAGIMVLPAAAQTSNKKTQPNTNPTSQSSQTSSSSSSQLSAADQRFMKKAAEDNLADIKLGQLAQQKATDNSVKQFAQKIVNDHQTANQKLEAIASKNNVTLPDKMNAKDQAFYDRLQNMSGKQFDNAYMNHMVRDHNRDVAKFKAESSKVQNPDLRAWVDQTLPALEQHDTMAKNTDQQIGGNPAAAGGHQHRGAQNNPSGSSMR
jgi:putative membrane protein